MATRRTGGAAARTRGNAAVLDQLQGVEAPVGAWESAILRARISDYQPRLLDELCAHGEVAWGRLQLPAPSPGGPHRPARRPPGRRRSRWRARGDLAWLLAAVRGGRSRSRPGRAPRARSSRRSRPAGRSFSPTSSTGPDGCLSRSPRRSGTASPAGSSPLTASERCGPCSPAATATPGSLAANRYSQHRLGGAGRRRLEPALAGGRWSLIEGPRPDDFDPDELADAVAAQLLERWGVVFRDLIAHEPLAIAWRDVLWALRRLEARGTARGGRFVAGFSGEQFALPEALDGLRRARAAPPGASRSGSPPPTRLNLTGSILGPERLPALIGRELTLLDGAPVADGGAPAGAARGLLTGCRRRGGLVALQPSLEGVELGDERRGQPVAEQLEVLPDRGRLLEPVGRVDGQHLVHRPGAHGEVHGAGSIPAGQVPDRGFDGTAATGAAIEDPCEDAGVLTETRPQEIAVGVAAEPVHVEDPRELAASSRSANESQWPQ